MTDRTDPPPPLPHLTGDQLRKLLAAEAAGIRLDCLVCDQPVLDQTFTLGPGGDETQRMLINSPCGHAMTYGSQLAQQVAALREREATEATETSSLAKGRQA